MSGGSTSTGSLGADNTRPNLIRSPAPESLPPGVSVNSPGFSRELFTIDAYELGGTLLGLGVIFCPWIIVLGLVLAYKTIVPYFIQY